MESSRTLEIKVGAFVLGGLAVLLFFFFVVGNPTFGPGIMLKLDYAFTGPIKQGAAVKISGVNVGKVREVEFMGARPADARPDHPIVRLHVFVEQRAQPLVTEGSRFFVTTLGVLGEHYVDVVPGPAGASQIGDGATVRGVDSPRTDMLMARMAQMMDQIGSILDRNEVQLVDLIGSAAALMKRVDAALGKTDVSAFLADVQLVLTDARDVLSAARTVLQDPEALAAMVQDGRVMVREGKVMIADAQGLLTEVKDTAPQMLRRADSLLVTAEGMSVRVDALLRALEKAGYTDEKRLSALLSQSETVMGRADNLSARADVLLQRIEKGEGTVGKLMKDEDVYRDLKSLLKEIRENPWQLMVPGKGKDR
ncbi:MAG: MlaD family protein [Myxococcota bacterium]